MGLKGKKCPQCDRENIINFSITSKENKNYLKFLILAKNLRRGSLYICPNCKIYWYFNPGDKSMSLVTERNIKHLEYWNSKRFAISEPIFEMLKSIGGFPLAGIAEAEHVSIPCKIVTKDGRSIDYCQFSFSTFPFFTFHDKEIIFADQILLVQESEYCLSKEVRATIYAAPEIAMGYAPTAVASNYGQKFIIPSMQDFFSSDGVKGKDVVLSQKSDFWKLEREGVPIVRSNSETTIVFGDWEPKCQQLKLNPMIRS